jgi:hypothetical protein
MSEHNQDEPAAEKQICIGVESTSGSKRAGPTRQADIINKTYQVRLTTLSHKPTLAANEPSKWLTVNTEKVGKVPKQAIVIGSVEGSRRRPEVGASNRTKPMRLCTEEGVGK